MKMFKYPLAITFRILFPIFLLPLFILNSCQKTDTEKPEEIIKETIKTVETEKFFAANQSANPSVIGAQIFLKSQDDKFHFTKEFINRIGMPLWNKSLVYENIKPKTIGINSTTSESPATVVYIPFVKDSQNYVDAAVLIKMTATDTAYRVLCGWQYSDFGFKDSDTSWNARDIFNIFSQLDKSVFGYTKYRIKDGRIFGYPKETQLVVTELPVGGNGNMATQSYTLECRSRTVCITADPSSNKISNAGNGAATNTVCHTYTTCTIVWGGGGPGPIPPGGGGGSPSGNPGGSGEGGPYIPPPCPELPRQAPVGTNVATVNPCDTVAWVPEPLQPNENIDGVDNICKSSFKFQIINPANGVGGWRAAGTTDIHVKIVDMSTGQFVPLYLPTVYFGLPIIRASGEFYSENRTQEIAAEAVKYGEDKVMQYYHSLGESLDIVGMSLYYRQKINEKMQDYGGSATLTPGSNVTITELGKASYGWPIIGCL